MCLFFFNAFLLPFRFLLLPNEKETAEENFALSPFAQAGYVVIPDGRCVSWALR